MSRRAGASVVGLDHVQVAAPPGCETEARRFFGVVLGLEEIPKPPGLAARGGCWFRVGTQEIHVGVVPEHHAAVKAHPGLRVASVPLLQDIARRLAAERFPVEWADADEIPGVTRLHTADPWGNRLELLAGA